MHLGIRLLFGVFAILGLAAFFVLNVFVNEIKPSVREVMEEVMIDSANVLAELATPDLINGTINDGPFAQAVRAYNARNPKAKVWGLAKHTVDFRVYVTDSAGIVRFDSENQSVGQDFSQWRDVLLTLKGSYGARTSKDARNDAKDGGSSVFYVAAPILRDGKTVGVLSIAKPTSTIAPFVDRAERKILVSGAWLLGLSLLIGMAATLWIVSSVRRLARYAEAVEAGQRTPVPALPGELGKLAKAMAGMRERLEGKHYIESTVRALTHELKSPLAAIRASGELLREDLPMTDRERFAQSVVQQSERMHLTVERMLELSKLEQLGAPQHVAAVSVKSLLEHAAEHARPGAERKGVRIVTDNAALNLTTQGDQELLQLALNNLVDNAVDFSSPDEAVVINANFTSGELQIDVTDDGPGFADYVRDRIGERFVSTPRPAALVGSHSKGSGLGLAIAKQVAELHGGRLAVVSFAKPTVVRMSLPASQ